MCSTLTTAIYVGVTHGIVLNGYNKQTYLRHRLCIHENLFHSSLLKREVKIKSVTVYKIPSDFFYKYQLVVPNFTCSKRHY